MKRFVLPALVALCLLPVAVAVGHKRGTYTGQFADGTQSAGNSFTFKATKKKAKDFDFQIEGSCSNGGSYRVTAVPDPDIQAKINKKDKFDETFPTNSGQGAVRIKGKFKKKRKASGFVLAQRFAPVTCTTGEQGWTAKK
jgi:hypothetical protein